MSYIQLEKGESIDKREIIGIFDLETTSISLDSRAIFKRMEEEKAVISLSNDIPKSFLLCDGAYSDRIYISGLSCESIKKRTEDNESIKTVWKRKAF